MSTKDQDLFGSVTNHTLVFECRPDKDLVKQDPIVKRGTVMAALSDSGAVFGYKIGDGKRRYSQLPYVSYDQYELKEYTKNYFHTPTNTIDGGTSNV